MTELEAGSLARAHEKPKINSCRTARHIAAFSIVAAITLLAILGGAVILFAQGQDKAKYSDIAGRNRVLRLQGLRGLVCGFFRAH
jgi:hypothetical protein